ncbi:MAG: hypothetical protein AAGA12_03820 [Pseudomonadota bacterium]
MFESIIASTSSEGLRPLGTPPQRSFELISGTLEQRLSPAHAQLFAEPVATSYGDKFDWYAPIEGTVTKLDALDEEEKALAQARLDGLLRDISELVETIAASSKADEQRLAESLSNALQVPGSEFIYVVTPAEGDIQPVLVNWAHVFDQQETVSRGLVGSDTRAASRAAAAATLASTAPPPPLTQTQQAKGQRGGLAAILPWLLWLGWLLLALIIAAILYLLIPACALNPFSQYSNCVEAQAPLSAAAAETKRLEDEIARVRQQLGVADRACQPLPPPPPPVPAPPPAPAPAPEPPQQDSEIDQRLNRAGAQRGDLSFSLAWNDTSDIDLHVTPAQCSSRIYYNRRNACRGTLDVDANANSKRRDPVENVFFVNPAPGNYKIRVHLYSGASSNRNFVLQIRDRGRVQTVDGTVGPRSRSWNYTYQTGSN